MGVPVPGPARSAEKERAETPEMKEEGIFGHGPRAGQSSFCSEDEDMAAAALLPVPLPVPGADAHPESQRGGRMLYLSLVLGFPLLLCHLPEPEGSLNITKRLV